MVHHARANRAYGRGKLCRIRMEFIPDNLFKFIASNKADFAIDGIFRIKAPEIHHLHVNAVDVPERLRVRAAPRTGQLAEEGQSSATSALAFDGGDTRWRK